MYIRISPPSAHRSANRASAIPAVKMSFAAVSSGTPNVSTRSHFLGGFWSTDVARAPFSHPLEFWGSAGSNPIYRGIPASRCRWIFLPKDIPDGVAEFRVKKEGRGSDGSAASYGLPPWGSKGVKSRGSDMVMMVAVGTVMGE